jgi:hypothetical protein
VAAVGNFALTPYLGNKLLSTFQTTETTVNPKSVVFRPKAGTLTFERHNFPFPVNFPFAVELEHKLNHLK